MWSVPDVKHVSGTYLCITGGSGEIRTRDQWTIDPLLCNVFLGALAIINQISVTLSNAYLTKITSEQRSAKRLFQNFFGFENQRVGQ